MNNRWFIAGGAGFIGSHFTDRLLSDPARQTRGSIARRYLLSGIAVCALCGSKLTSKPGAAGRQRAMVCRKGAGRPDGVQIGATGNRLRPVETWVSSGGDRPLERYLDEAMAMLDGGPLASMALPATP